MWASGRSAISRPVRRNLLASPVVPTAIPPALAAAGVCSKSLNRAIGGPSSAVAACPTRPTSGHSF